ncbi:MAG TPA: glycosyltransferase family 2 protein [Saprospiraceae bacterium]|nr:glycosyltransferase family 2 protein [Saprospiraceae bacterium]
MSISIVIPCYNVANHIDQVIRGIPADIDWIIAVNDCSKDNTENILLRLAGENPRVIYIKHEINKGVGGAMMTGYEKAKELNADIIIKIDGDGQMDPAYIPALLKPLLHDKADFTKGNRFRDFKALRSMPLSRRIGNLGLSFMIKAASGYWNIFDPANGYTAIRLDTLKNIDFQKIHNRYFFESSMLIELYYVNAVIQDIPMKAKYGNEISGLSRLKTLFEFPPKLFLALIKRIILKYFLFDFNIASLYIFFGFVFMLTGFIYGLLNFIKYYHLGIGSPTGTVVVSTLLVTLGFQLLLAAISFDITNYPKKNS